MYWLMVTQCSITRWKTIRLFCVCHSKKFNVEGQHWSSVFCWDLARVCESSSSCLVTYLISVTMKLAVHSRTVRRGRWDGGEKSHKRNQIKPTHSRLIFPCQRTSGPSWPTPINHKFQVSPFADACPHVPRYSTFSTTLRVNYIQVFRGIFREDHRREIADASRCVSYAQSTPVVMGKCRDDIVSEYDSGLLSGMVDREDMASSFFTTWMPQQVKYGVILPIGSLKETPTAINSLNRTIRGLGSCLERWSALKDILYVSQDFPELRCSL